MTLLSIYVNDMLFLYIVPYLLISQSTLRPVKLLARRLTGFLPFFVPIF